MIAVTLLSIWVALALLAVWLSARVRDFALRKGIEDIPNERSSHKQPTPRGGGLAIVAVCQLSLVVLLIAVPVTTHWALSALIGGALIAGIGWWDDRVSLSARVRLAVQMFAALIAVVPAGWTWQLTLATDIHMVGVVASVFAFLLIVWMTNLYNFMDGIDGIAGSQGVTCGWGVAWLAWDAGLPHLALVALGVSAACAGFLPLNWQPAKLFMGDVGSAYLGYIFALFALWGASTGKVSLATFGLVMGVFIVDATYTLIRRLIGGEKVYQAHRSHAYQRATQRGARHAQVTTVVILINVVLLIPSAWMSRSLEGEWQLAVVGFWYIVGACVAGYFNAGKQQ